MTMTPRHHLDPATVVSYAAGSLPVGLSVIVATHLETCAHCRAQVADAERIGGLLIEQQQPLPEEDRMDRLRQSMLQRLADDLPAPDLPVHRDSHAVADADADRLPLPLHPYFGTSYRALKWRWMAPGVHLIRAAGHHSGNLILLKIGPGRSMPVHGHGGSELTQILQGAYDDALGHFAPGDVADLDSEVEHQPVTTAEAACICVSALDAPLRFPGWLARKLQPLFGL